MIDPKEAPEGCRAIAENYRGCAGCFFLDVFNVDDVCLTAVCCAPVREDGIDVIFVKADEPS
jgi:hypothetical protein